MAPKSEAADRGPAHSDLEKEKLQLDVDKVKAELRDLNRPLWLRSNTWFGAVAAIGVLVGMFSQVALFNVRLEKAQLDTEKAQKALAEVQQQYDEAASHLGNVVAPNASRTADGKVILNGIVVRENGEPVEGALVHVTRYDSNDEEIVTSKDGKFRFELKPGNAAAVIATDPATNIQRTVEQVSTNESNYVRVFVGATTGELRINPKWAHQFTPSKEMPSPKKK